MDIKKYRQVRVLVALFVAMIVSVSMVQDSYILAAAGILTGMVFMLLVRSKTKITVDEREKTVREKAAQLTYSIFTPTIGLGSFFLIILGSRNFYMQALGQVFAYLTLFMMAVYAISYYFLDKRYGGDGNE